VFSMTPAGVVTLLHNFGDGTVSNDGSDPGTALVQGSASHGDNNFYGVTPGGGANGSGAFFSVTSQGAVTILHSFGGAAVDTSGNPAIDGASPSPSAGLILGADGNFYGTTVNGGANTTGTVFKVTPQGAVTILHSFGGGNDGTYPTDGVAQGADGNFYGTTSNGGTGSAGVAFEVTGQGTETILHNFGDGSAIKSDSTPAAADGSSPVAGLIEGSDGNFYGVTAGGGTGPVNTSGQVAGTIFKIAIGTPSLLARQLIDGYVGVSFALPVNASNQPTNYSAANLPAGLGIDPASGVISGVPTAQGTGSAIVTFTNAAGSNFAVLDYSISGYLFPIGMSLPAGVILNPTVPSGGSTPNYWTISTLPAGLSFDPSTGTLSGTPSVAGKLTFTVTAYYQDPSTSDLTQLGSQNYTMLFPWTFAEWETHYGMATPLYNPNRSDGVPVYLKYFCDIDPSGPMATADFAALPSVNVKTVGNVSYEILTYRQSQLTSGIYGTLETSTDMVTWNPVSADYTNETTDPSTGDPIIETGVKTTGASLFIRLNVSPTQPQ